MKKHALSTALEIKDKIYEKGRNLFTGVIFYELGNGHLTGRYVEEGVLTNKPYLSPCLPGNIKDDESIPLMKEDAFEYSGGALFTHNTYTLATEKVIIILFKKNGYSQEEEYYEDGFQEHHIAWDSRGEVFQASLESKNVKLTINSDEASFKYELNSGGFFSFGINQENEVFILNLSDQITNDDLKVVYNEFNFILYKTPEEILVQKFSLSLTLNSYIKKNEILEQFFRYKEENKIDQVIILTHNGNENLSNILKFPNLKTLRLFWYKNVEEKNVKTYQNLSEKLKFYLSEYEKKYNKKVERIYIEYDFEKMDFTY